MTQRPILPTLPDHVLLGMIGTAHGIKGEVSITTYTEDPASILDYGPLTDGTRTIEIIDLRVTPKTVIAVLEGVTDRTAAEAFRNTPLYVPRSALPAPKDDDAYYFEDLKGMTVVDGKGATFGVVIDVVNFGAGDLIEIRSEGHSDTEYFAFTDAVVPHVDLKARRLTLIVPETTGDDEREKS